MIILQILTLVVFLVVMYGLVLGLKSGWTSEDGGAIFGVGMLILGAIGVFGWGLIANSPLYYKSSTIYWPIKKLASGEVITYSDTESIIIADNRLLGQIKDATTVPVIKTWQEDLYGDVMLVNFKLDERNILLNYPLTTEKDNAPK